MDQPAPRRRGRPRKVHPEQTETPRPRGRPRKPEHEKARKGPAAHEIDVGALIRSDKRLSDMTPAEFAAIRRRALGMAPVKPRGKQGADPEHEAWLAERYSGEELRRKIELSRKVTRNVRRLGKLVDAFIKGRERAELEKAARHEFDIGNRAYTAARHLGLPPSKHVRISKLFKKFEAERDARNEADGADSEQAASVDLDELRRVVTKLAASSPDDDQPKPEQDKDRPQWGDET